MYLKVSCDDYQGIIVVVSEYGVDGIPFIFWIHKKLK